MNLPEHSHVNFAVPSVNVLSLYHAKDVESQIPKSIPPGVLHLIIELLNNDQSNEYMLCADGKKVTTGVDSKGWDVYIIDLRDYSRMSQPKIMTSNTPSLGQMMPLTHLTEAVHRTIWYTKAQFELMTLYTCVIHAILFWYDKILVSICA